MQDRQGHQREVQAFIEKHFPGRSWEFSLPKGHGHETYFARSNDDAFFVKLGARAAVYEAMASTGLTPPVLAAATLGDGISIIVQPYIDGRRPSRRDYRERLEQFASTIHKVHHNPEVKRALPKAPSDLYSAAGLEALDRIRQRWERHRSLVLEVADFVDESLDQLEGQAGDFQGSGLVASHNDICNANWLISPEGQLYLVDLEAMSLDDPALDTGATLWWYYPPELRQRFLEITGYANDEAFTNRMRVRMAMHCLHITLPREQSFDEFDAASFPGSLEDFRAIMDGEENPRGYED